MAATIAHRYDPHMAPRKPVDDPNAIDMRDAIVRTVLLAISGIRIGVVKAYDPVKRTADVQPVRRRVVWRKPVEQPVVAQAPVGWWRFGGMVLAGELEPGDEVLLLTSEREVWPWYLQGGLVDPASERMHDRTDTIVMPWISNLKRAITARATRSFFMGREDGTAGITIPMDVPARIEVDAGPLGIVLGSGAVSPALLGTQVVSAMTTWTGAVGGAGTTWAATVPPTAISNGAFIGTLITATAALALTLPSWLAVKVAVE